MCVAVRQLRDGQLSRAAAVKLAAPRRRVWKSRMEDGKWVPGIKDLAEVRKNLPLGCMALHKGVVRELPRSVLLHSLDGKKGKDEESKPLSGAHEERTPHLATAEGKMVVPLRPYLGKDTISRLEEDGAELLVVAEVVNKDGEIARIMTPIKASDAAEMPRIMPGGVVHEIYAVVTHEEATHIAEATVQRENGGNHNTCW